MKSANDTSQHISYTTLRASKLRYKLSQFGTENQMKAKLALPIFVVSALVAVIACGSHATSSDAINAVGTASGVAGSAAADFGPMTTVNIIDPMFNMVAYTVSIPKSWRFEGTVLHGPGCLTGLSEVVFRAYSPDLLYGIQSIPTSNFFWADDKRAIPAGPACKILPPMSAADYGKLIAIKMRPDSVVDSVEASPNEAAYQANLNQSNQMLAAQAASVGNRNPITSKGELKRLHIHYVFNGHPEEEWLDVAMSVADQPTSVIVSQPGRAMQTAIKHRIASSPLVSGSRAPLGQYQAHAEAMKAIGMSFKANPDYNARYAAYMQDNTNKSIATSWAVTNSILKIGQQEQAQRTQNAQAFIQNMQKQGDERNAQFAANQAQKSANVAGFNANEAQRSAHAADVSDYLLDQQLYVNPSTGQKQMQSNQYSYTYSDGSGPGSSVVQTNSPNSNPNGVLVGNWTELQPIHH